MTESLSTGRAAALYIGALLGPGLLLLPALAARAAGPASILAWVGLLALSGLFAAVFTALGVRFRSRGGVAAYAAAAFGPTAGRAVAWCFLAGVVLGAPVVCLIGAGYVAALFGGGRGATVAIAAALLAVVVALTLGGARASSAIQYGLVALLVALIVVAVVGSAGAARMSRWTPFAPHGWTAIGSAASLLMLSFVGWEAIAPMTARLRDPARQLPRVIAVAFGVTAAIYLALAGATISVLGTSGSTPLADLLDIAIGPAGRALAAVVAAALTVATVNAYLSGAAELLAELRGGPSRQLQPAIGVVGALLLAGVGVGLVSATTLVVLPTTLFLAVYLGCTAAAARILPGASRLAAAVACAVVAVVLGFSGWALLAPAAVITVVLAANRHEIRRQHGQETRNRLLMRGAPCG